MTEGPLQREEQLRTDGYLIAILLVCVINGMTSSPYFAPLSILMRPLMASFGLSSPILLIYFTSMALTTFTAILSGLPAAMFERATGRRQSDSRSLQVWLGAAVLLSLPGLMAVIGLR